MATEPEYREQRRGERVLIRIPVKLHVAVEDGTSINAPAEAVVVSRYGALLRTASPPKTETTIEVLNTFSREVERFRVVWVSEKPKEGQYDVGVEILTPRENFWGIRFPDKDRKA